MLIKDIFSYPVGRQITQVIKLDDVRPAELAQELSEYVVTEQIEKQLLQFLEPFTATGKGQHAHSDKIGVWLSGFFGSGKSHLAKIIGLLLQNETVTVDGTPREAVELFLDRVVDQSPRKQELKELLTQMRFSFQNQVLMFEIKSQEDQLDRINDTITRILYSRYLEMLGLSGDPWIGSLELSLSRRDRLMAFRSAIEEEEGEDWEELRKDFAFVRPAVVRALCKAVPEIYRSEHEADKAFDDIRSGLRMTPENLTEELAAYAATEDAKSSEHAFKVVFIIDEIGQFIGDDRKLLLELQALAHQFATKGAGRLWLIVTSQEALDQVIAGVKGREQDFTTIMDRFEIQLRLTSENIEQVLEERILKKRPAAHASIHGLFERYQGQISFLAKPDSNRQIIAPDHEQFERAYPFLPYYFQFMQEVFSGLRTRSGRVVQLSGAERSMLGVMQGVLNDPVAKIGESKVGRLVTLAEIYDQVLKEISGQDRRTISGVAEYVNEQGYPPERVLKAVFLMNQVEWISRSSENIARVLMPSAGDDFNNHHAAVNQALTDLKTARYIIEVEGQFRYLSAAERDIEDKMAGIHPKHGEIRRAGRDLLKSVLGGIGRLNYENGLATFDVRIFADEEEVRSTGEITLKVFSPIYRNYESMLNLSHYRDIESPGDERTVYWLPGEITDPQPDLERLLRITAITQQPVGTPSEEERGVLREKETEADGLRTRVSQAFTRALFTGLVVYDGDVVQLDGKATHLNSIFNRELSKVVLRIYTRFGPAAVKATEKNISDMLTARSASLATLVPELRLWDAQGHLNTSAAVVEPVLDALRRHGMGIDGKMLSESFTKPPFGWEPVVLRLVLAALFREGTISISVGGRNYTEPSNSTAQEALVKVATFNKALFEYDPSGALTLDERREAARQIDILFDRKVDDSINSLAAALQDELGRLKHDNDLLVAQSTALPVPEDLALGSASIDTILARSRPDEKIREFLSRAEVLKVLQAVQRNLRAFIKQGGDKVYGRMRRLIQEVERSRSQVKALDTEEVDKALNDVHVLEESRLLIERWPDAQRQGQILLAAYRQAYIKLFAERSQLYTRARDNVAPFGNPPAAILNRIVLNHGNWEDEQLGYPDQQVSLIDLQNDILLVKEREIDAIAELVKQDDSQDEGDDLSEQPVLIRVGDYFGGEISDQKMLIAQIDHFSRAVQAALQRGRKVIIR